MISLATDARESPAAFLDKVRAGEAGGAARMWIANHLFQRDPVTFAALALGAAPRLPVALMAMSPFTLHPVQAAMAAATLDEAFPGRVTLCFGVGAPVDLASTGIEVPKPLGPMHEAIDVARALLAGEPVKYEGKAFKVRDRGLAAGARPVPIVLAASGPQMLALAGAAADGVLVSAGTSVEFVRWCLDHVARGAAGRRVRACGLVYASVDVDRAAAHARLKRLLAILLRGAHHATNLELGGTVLDQAALRDAAARGDWAAAEALVTPEVIARHAICGTPEEAKARVEAYRGAGLDEIVLSGPSDGPRAAALLRACR